MRVLHVTPYFAPAFRYGGPPRSILGLCRALGEAGVDVEVFTTTANGPEPLPAAPEGTEYDGVRVRYFPLAWPQRYWRAAGLGAALDRALAAADLVHVHGLWNMTGSTAVARARAAGRPVRRLAARHAAAGGDAAPSCAEVGRLLGHASARTCSGAAFLHATSTRRSSSRSHVRSAGRDDRQRRHARRRVGRRARATPASARGSTPATRWSLCLGRLHPIKRLDLLAAAFAIVHQRASRARGSSSPDRTKDGYRARVEPLFAPVAGATRWLGAVDAETTGALFAASRTLVQCSDSESFGMSVAEALAAGLPVVVTNRNAVGADRQRSGSDTRWLTNRSAIAEASCEILEHPADGCAMGARGKAWARETFGWDAIGRCDARRVPAACSIGRGGSAHERRALRSVLLTPNLLGADGVSSLSREIVRALPRPAAVISLHDRRRAPGRSPADLEMHGAGGGRARFLAAVGGRLAPMFAGDRDRLQPSAPGAGRRAAGVARRHA